MGRHEFLNLQYDIHENFIGKDNFWASEPYPKRLIYLQCSRKIHLNFVYISRLYVAIN